MGPPGHHFETHCREVSKVSESGSNTYRTLVRARRERKRYDIEFQTDPSGFEFLPCTWTMARQEIPGSTEAPLLDSKEATDLMLSSVALS